MNAVWSAAFENAPVAVLISEGTQHRIRYVNPTLCRILSIAPDQLVGREIAAVFPGPLSKILVSLADAARADIAREPQTVGPIVAAGSGPWLVAAWRLDNVADDQLRTVVQFTSAPVNGISQAEYDAALDEIRTINGQLVISNVRAQQLLEEAEEAAHAKDSFLAMLGHELRNPLAPIRNSVEILRRAQLPDPELIEAREIIARQSAHMTRLVDDLLDVSRLTHGKISLHARCLDAVDVVRAVLDDYRPNFEAAHLSVVSVLPPHPLWIVGDPTRLGQIIGNILQNAIKFTDAQGQVRVVVRADDGTVVISVRDTGIGMERQMVDEVFALFRQADNTLDRSRGGLGIGLSLARGLVELHRGEIQAASEGLGRGSEFTVRIPLTSPPDVSSEPSRMPEKDVTCARVLLVEDNLDAAESMRMLLQLRGHRVEVAHTGTDAVGIARRFRPEVVLCDIGLPGDMDGYAVARAIRDDPRIPAARMIAITGYGQIDDIRLAREAGFEQHLTKPVEPERLYELLKCRK